MVVGKALAPDALRLIAIPCFFKGRDNYQGTRVSTSDCKKNIGQKLEELTKVQKDGITTRLTNNPVVEFVGIQLQEVAAGKATLVLPYREELRNSIGLLQGGILGVLADVAGGVSLYSVLPDPLNVVIPTIEFKLNFLKPAREGDIVAQGRVVHHGRQIAVCQVDICTEEGALLATGLFTYRIKDVDAEHMLVGPR